MPKRGKRYRALAAQVGDKPYSLEEASTLIRSLANARFDETIEVHLKLGIDPKKTDQNVRGTVALPHGTGRRVRVIAITKGDGLAAAEQAGADLAGGEELINRISDGFLDFDAVVATPDMMAQIGSRLARLLGPRGLLPNPRSGTVGQDIAGMVRPQGRPHRVPERQDRCSPRPGRQGQLCARAALREHPRPAGSPGSGQACRSQGGLPALAAPQLHHGASPAGEPLRSRPLLPGIDDSGGPPGLKDPAETSGDFRTRDTREVSEWQTRATRPA